jgi:hypothetical protein
MSRYRLWYVATLFLWDSPRSRATPAASIKSSTATLRLTPKQSTHGLKIATAIVYSCRQYEEEVRDVMGYDLTIVGASSRDRESVDLHLSVWEMSKIRDRMLTACAADCGDPPDRAMRPDRRQTCQRASGIPAYKLASIDGWVVHPFEIRQTLKALRRAGLDRDLVDDTWSAWMRFLHLAARCGGFTVD